MVRVSSKAVPAWLFPAQGCSETYAQLHRVMPPAAILRLLQVRGVQGMQLRECRFGEVKSPTFPHHETLTSPSHPLTQAMEAVAGHARSVDSDLDLRRRLAMHQAEVIWAELEGARKIA